ncbi:MULTISPECIES: transglutaminaseTgpA domain-containing protein [unclassified Pseudoalteromonas]|uniref:transglutaminase family protein n=1 Tax=unclassified Pseudoalteromonas TaxID=194690 RepID=UPI0038641335
MNNIKNEKIVNFSLCFIYAFLIVFFIAHLPIAFVSVLATLCVWNFVIAFRNTKKPNAWLANILAGFSLVVMIYSVGMSDTVILFVAMLLLSSIFKLLQAKTKKHYHIIITLTFFSLSSAYLFNQSIITTLVVSGLFILNFAVLGLLESKHNLKMVSKQSSKLFLMALPLAIFLLLFLPKIPAFWQLPGPKLAKTGLSEQVDPFDIAKLSNSDELVFRATFNQQAPSSPYYWRAIVHDEFNGNAWLTSDYLKYNNQSNNSSSVTNNTQKLANYTIIAEPATQKWLYGLAYSMSNSKNVNNSLLGILRKKNYQAKSLQYNVSSFDFESTALEPFEKKRYTYLAHKQNSQASKLATGLMQHVNSDRDFYNALLQYFVEKEFKYTLTPSPMSGDNTIDQFLFENKRGFCGHYASAAAYIFRNADIPARVVSGYLGGELNQDNNTLTVRQYDAHAWVEVYLENEGWVIFDATAVVAPERLNGSLSQNDELNDEFKSNLDFGLVRLSNFAAINWLRLEIENLDYKWSSWVLGFDDEKQSDFLKSFFGSKNSWLVPLMVLLIAGFSFAGYFVYLNWPQKSKTKPPPIVKEYLEILRWAQKNKVIAPEHLTPNQQLEYISQKKPEVGLLIIEFSQLFNQVRYAKTPFTKERKTQAKDLIKLIKSTNKRKI